MTTETDWALYNNLLQGLERELLVGLEILDRILEGKLFGLLL